MYPGGSTSVAADLAGLVNAGIIGKGELTPGGAVPIGQRLREDTHIECSFARDATLVAVLEDGAALFMAAYTCREITKQYWVHSPHDLLVQTIDTLLFRVIRYFVVCNDGSVLVLNDFEIWDSGLVYVKDNDVGAARDCMPCRRRAPRIWTPPAWIPPENPRHAFSVREGERSYIVYRDAVWRLLPPLRYESACVVVATYERWWLVTTIPVADPIGVVTTTWEQFEPSSREERRFRVPDCTEERQQTHRGAR